MRHPLREKECIIFRKHALIKGQQELASIWRQSLDRMRISGWEVPEIAFAHIVDKDRPIRIQYRDTGISIEHDGPLIRCVPMQFAKAANRQAHVDARYVCA